MSIESKLNTVYDNTQKVYDAGYAAGRKSGGGGDGSGYDEGYTDGYADGEEKGFSDGKSAGYTEGYSKGETAGKNAGLTEGYNNGYSEGYSVGKDDGIDIGKQAEYDAFWDAFQQNGNRRLYSCAFGSDGWTMDILKPKYPIQVGYAYRMFETSTLTDISSLDIDFSECTNFTMAFANSMITKIGVIDTRSASNLIYMLSSATRVVSVKKIILKEDGSQSLGTSVFNAMSSLKDIVFEGVIGNSVAFSQSNQLSNDSVQSIIDALADLTSSTAQKVQFHSTVLENLTEEQMNAISSKNWTF